jgi:3-oxoacyl-[acyl-carrier-protein] synthase III
MNISRIQNVKIEAIAACVPRKKIDNYAAAKELFSEDMSPTIAALGIQERHICRLETSTALDLSLEAAKEIFRSHNIRKEDIGGVVFVTLTPDNLMPNNASLIQHELNLPNDLPAFDINHACSGYIYGLWTASLIAGNMNKKILLLDGDVNSRYSSKWDKNTSLLFGDAGTATIITPESHDKEWAFTFSTDGSNREALIIPGIGFRTPLSQNHLEYLLYEDGRRRRLVDLKMDGSLVFNYVVNTVPKLVKIFFDENEFFVSEFDYLILHQANAFMLRKLAKKIDFDLSKVPMSISKFGNTSSASIPLNICSELDNNKIVNKRLLLIGMGAGLSTAIGTISTEGTKSYGVSMVDI